MNIRQEQKEDYKQIYRLIETAFETAKVRDGDEQDYTSRLRESASYIPELALVAEHDGNLIGHIMFTKTNVTDGGQKHEVLLLSPLSVLLEHRSKGVGAALVTEGFRLARKMGYTAVFLAGDPAYYGKFGFRPTFTFGIACPDNIPKDLHGNFMACELVPGALDNIQGTADIR